MFILFGSYRKPFYVLFSVFGITCQYYFCYATGIYICMCFILCRNVRTHSLSTGEGGVWRSPCLFTLATTLTRLDRFSPEFLRRNPVISLLRGIKYYYAGISTCARPLHSNPNMLAFPYFVCVWPGIVDDFELRSVT